ncbi:hypothetical protein ACFWOB_37910 [Streptomyces sp. NPDC058420]|uniref:hypothetical protein n=1 Tax=Streptomyces sp. NPDC058420 TaxID=3346489 RepID=UPI00365CD5F8
MVWTGLAAAACALVAVSGVVAVTTGRMLPTLQGRVVRPELWGLGQLVFAAGMATGISLRWWAGSLAMGDAGAATALVLIVLGCVVQWRAQHPAPR